MNKTKARRGRLFFWLVGAAAYVDVLVPACTQSDSDSSGYPDAAAFDSSAALPDSAALDAPVTTDAPPQDATPYDAPFMDAPFDAPADAPLPFGQELLVNGGFETTDVQTGGLPASAGIWRGDVASRVMGDQGIAPHGGAQMLKFQAVGPSGGSAANLACQQWQLVDLSAFAAPIDAGKVRLDASIYFNRISGDGGTDQRFDMRILAFSGAPASFPASYPPPAGQIRGTQLASTGTTWQKVDVTFDVLPVATRYVAVEIYAYEDVVDDVSNEFHGHYADDASLVLTLLP